MAANSICWQMPSNFRFYSAKLKRIICVQPFLLEFRRLLESSITAVEGVSNQDLLHAVVALYDHCLPEITPEVLYTTVCGKWAKTLILLRDFQDVLQELESFSLENSHNSDLEMGKFTSVSDGKVTEHLKHGKESEMKDASLSINNVQVSRENKSVSKLSQQVSCSGALRDDQGKDPFSRDRCDKEETVFCDKCASQISSCHCDSAIVLERLSTQGRDLEAMIVTDDDDINKNKEEDKPGKFDGVFSDTDDSEGTAESDDEEEDFSKGAEDFVEAAKNRRKERQSDIVSESSIGIESLIVAAVTYERSYGVTRHRPSEKVVQLNLLTVRKRCRKSGVGKFLLQTLKDPTVIGPYNTIAVYADNDAVDFFKRNGFTDDVVLCSRFSELTDHWINSTLMCYLPPFTGSDFSGVFRSEDELKEMDDEIRKWREKSLEAYQAQSSCMARMQHEIKTLKAMVDTQDEAIKTLTNAKGRLEKEKYELEKELLRYKMEGQEGRLDDQDFDENDDVYEALAQMLSKKHLSEPELDLEAISQGNFRDISKEDEKLVFSFITTHGERQLVQQIRRSLLSTKNFTDITINRVRKVESCHIAFMEASFDSRTQRLGDPVICTQLYFCGGADDEQISRIMKQGFTKEDFTRGPYGKGLYFSMHASQAVPFSAPGKLLLANVGLGLTESVVVQDHMRTLPPAGFDSILTSGRLSSLVTTNIPQQEYVIFDPMQAIPIYLVEYSTNR